MSIQIANIPSSSNSLITLSHIQSHVQSLSRANGSQEQQLKKTRKHCKELNVRIVKQVLVETLQNKLEQQTSLLQKILEQTKKAEAKTGEQLAQYELVLKSEKDLQSQNATLQSQLDLLLNDYQLLLQGIFKTAESMQLSQQQNQVNIDYQSLSLQNQQTSEQNALLQDQLKRLKEQSQQQLIERKDSLKQVAQLHKQIEELKLQISNNVLSI